VADGAVTSTERERERDSESKRERSRGSYPFKYIYFFSLEKNNLKEMARWRTGIVPRCGPGQISATWLNATWPIRDVYLYTRP
jgi:hypothetical protein